MQIPLSEFELHVRPEPLERGLALYERGAVESMHRVGKGVLEAVVQDSDGTWHPQLKVEKEAIVGSTCKCEHAGEGLCRHAIAMVFAMEAGQFKEGITTKSGKMPKEKAPAKGRGRLKVGDEPAPPKPVKAKPPKPIKTAADIVARVPHEELVAFLLQECKLDKNIELRLKAHFADLLPATTMVEIEKRISETFKAAQGKKGKMNKGSIEVLVKRLNEWVQESGRMIEAQAYDLAYAAAKNVVLILMELPGLTDTAQDAATAAVKLGISHLDRISKAELPEPMRLEIFKRASESQMGYNRHLSLLRIIARLCKPGAEYEQAKSVFRSGNDDQAEVTELNWEMVLRVEGEAKAAEFAKSQASTRFFLMREIEAARAQGDTAKALKLVRKGFNINQHFSSRLAHWTHLEHEILTESKDTEGLVELVVKLYKLGYQTTKVSLRNIAEVAGRDRWIAERAKLLEDKDIRKWQHQEAISALFEIDQDWNGMAEYISKHSNNIVLSWSANMGRRNPAVAWLVVTQLAEKIMDKPSRVTQTQLTDIIRELVALRGKPLALEFFKNMLTNRPKEELLAEIIRGWDKITNYMYERSRFGF